MYEDDITTDSWSSESTSLPRRLWHACLAIEEGQKILVANGYYYNGTDNWYSNLEILNTTNKVWSPGPEFPLGFHASSMVQASPYSEYVAYTFGGYGPRPGTTRTITDIYGVTKDFQNIVKIGDLMKGRVYHKAIKLPNKITGKCQEQL